ncbi:hypothetical protein SCLCIDRAFT_1224652 [Scleroderma citrinum Foug A]|uniref:Fe2OG dioxygenase domain-containing protein n=1 Tax=Scleroderma citrinum Foug A TaxID=1036808 RepID=A0A0C3D5E4_9AGAM|nr:hypothetical protein SCLCIDRAFT_1224652 [Scleroderma citrinum Foug A]
MPTNRPNIPVLDLALLSDETKRPEFMALLRHALINIGFLYLKNSPVPQELIGRLVEYIPRLFDLPQDEKDKISMVNSPHFYGYSRFAEEYTEGETDHREHFDFATPYETRWKPGGPDHLGFFGPCQWLDEDLLPGFRETMETYLIGVHNAGVQLMSLIAEALQLPSDAFAKFYYSLDEIQSRAKVIKYPPQQESQASVLGNTPHFDTRFVTFVLQLPHPRPTLQVQLGGEWIDATPIPGTFVVNFGKSLEYVTQGLVKATYHRVLSPPAGSPPRYSVPLFQGTRLDMYLADEILDFPPEILKLKDLREDPIETNTAKDNEFYSQLAGDIIFLRGIMSHPDITEQFYPHLFKKYFPDGMPKQLMRTKTQLEGQRDMIGT